MARIFNLARKYKDILINGVILPEDTYGEKAVSRGDQKTRLITLRNLSWLPVSRTIRLDKEIGLTAGSQVEVKEFHPTEKHLGNYKMGQSVTVEILPFRSVLLMATTEKQTGAVVEGCNYEIVREVAGKSLKMNLLGFPGEKKTIRLKGVDKSIRNGSLDGKTIAGLSSGKPIEVVFPGTPLKEKYHRKLGNLVEVPVPKDAQALYEATCFAADNNALEARSLVRSGPSSIAQVQKARDAFFEQEVFTGRGLWDRYLFDGELSTAFYPTSRRGIRDARINGGALRVEFGSLTSLDSLRITFGNDHGLQPFKPWEALRIEVSADLQNWESILTLANQTVILPLDPARKIRFVRFPASPVRVVEMEGFLNGQTVDRIAWRASNLFSTYRQAAPKTAYETSFVLPEIPKGSYLAVALNGKHGVEGAYAAARVNGQPIGAPDRSISYPSNAWEGAVRESESNYTYYIPVTPDMAGKKMDVVVLLLKNGLAEFNPEVWITAYPIPYEKIELELPDKYRTNN